MLKTLRKVGVVGLGGGLAQVATVAAMPLLTRQYSPDAFAGWALFVSVVALFTTIATLRFELAVMLPSTHEEASTVMTLCALSSVGMALCSVLLLPLLGGLLVGREFEALLTRWWWSIPLMIIAMGIYQASNSWCTRTQEFAWYGFSQVVLPLLTVVLQIAAGASGHGDASGLIAGTVIAQVSTAVILWVLIRRKYGHLLQLPFNWKQVAAMFVRYRNYPLFMTPYTLAGTTRDRVLFFLLGNLAGAATVGHYSLASRLVNMPNSLVTTAVRPVFFQQAASKGLKSTEQTVARIQQTLALCIIPFWILFVFHARTIFAVVFGESWRDAATYAAILSLPAVMLLLTSWLDRVFDVAGRQRLAFGLEMAFSLLAVGVLTVSMMVFKKAVLAIVIQSVVLTLYYGSWLSVIFHLAGFNRRSLLRLGGMAALLAGISALVTWELSVVLPRASAIAATGLLATVWVSAYLFVQWRRLKREAAGL